MSEHSLMKKFAGPMADEVKCLLPLNLEQTSLIL